MPETKRLTKKQALFVQEYLVDLNATQAAIRAGYSPKTAGPMGGENLRKPEIGVAIQEALLERGQRLEVTQDRVLQEFARIAFADMRTYTKWTPDGVTLINSDDLPDGASRVVAEVSETVTGTGKTVRFKLYSKQAALESLAKHLGMDRKAGDTEETPLHLRLHVGEEQHVWDGFSDDELARIAAAGESLKALPPGNSG